MEIKILVATHKKYWFPEYKIYCPISVGSALRNDLGYLRDCIGENISKKNMSYCELTAVYWGWKNLKTDYIGLCHYRRYFIGINKKIKKDNIITEEEIKYIMSKYDLILPKKSGFFTNFTIYKQYQYAHKKKDLDLVKNIIEEYYPEYIISFNKVMKQRKAYFYNMFIMSKPMFDSYCEWLFDILFKLENKIDVEKYSNYQKRVFGFLSERLFNVWIDKQNLKICELDIINLEKNNTIRDKIYSFFKNRRIYG